MKLYKYTLDKTNIEVKSRDVHAHYHVQWNGVYIGYIYVADICDELGCPIWSGSTPLLNLHAPEIGLYIEDSELIDY